MMADLYPPAFAGERARTILGDLASTLGCTPESFSDPEPTEISQTLELLSLWLGIEDRQARARALTAVRSAINTPMGKTVTLEQALQKPDRI